MERPTQRHCLPRGGGKRAQEGKLCLLCPLCKAPLKARPWKNLEDRHCATAITDRDAGQSVLVSSRQPLPSTDRQGLCFWQLLSSKGSQGCERMGHPGTPQLRGQCSTPASPADFLPRCSLSLRAHQEGCEVFSLRPGASEPCCLCARLSGTPLSHSHPCSLFLAPHLGLGSQPP